MSTETMHPKSKLQSVDSFHYSQINFPSLIYFSHHGNFPKLDFQAGQWQLGKCRARYSLRRNRQPHQCTRGRRLDLVAKDIIGRLGQNFFVNCTRHNSPRPLRNSFVADLLFILSNNA